MQALVQAPQPLPVEPAFVTLHHTDPSLGDQLGALRGCGLAVHCKEAPEGSAGSLAQLTDASVDDVLHRLALAPAADVGRGDWRAQALSDVIQHDHAVAAACAARAAAGKTLPDLDASLLYPATHPAVACNCRRLDPRVRTDPQECTHPSHFLARGMANALRQRMEALRIPRSRRGDDKKKHLIPVAEAVQHLSNHWQQPARSRQHWDAVATANKRRAGSKGGSSTSTAKQRTWFTSERARQAGSYRDPAPPSPAPPARTNFFGFWA